MSHFRNDIYQTIALVRALASHRCGPGSVTGTGVIWGLSLLLVLVPATKVFLRVLQRFLPPQKPALQIPIRSGNEGQRFVSFAVSVTLPK